MRLYMTQQVSCPWILDQLNGVCRNCAEGHMDQERLEFRLECEYFLVREVLPRVMEINKKLNEGSEECAFNVRFFHEYKNAEDAARARQVVPTEDCFHTKIY
ncbi:hypothetical protein CRM22_010093 [Opisthorchis felineus]|uniref:Uncharacterized protein n=1 Tax=Opisthorchis felineus TaxID=147828 RepID=A0A4S2L212_OPIFE|nr:hypothetical protein CRM22_010093 [Opisthorchis felineus]